MTYFRDRTPIWDGPEYEWGRAAAKACGAEWGGNWTNPRDLPHFQYPGTQDMDWQNRMRDRIKRGLPVILPAKKR